MGGSYSRVGSYSEGRFMFSYSGIFESPSFRIWSYHDNRFLYMLLEYVPGGELFTYLRTAHRFDNTTSLFFASEIVMALDYLHSLNIVYR